ncbi:TRAP transporter large permease [Bradyrhizobium roseum]|uniref:TRAP transporter large permease n=1 Tax=Bradyrhizobium roseum TaxID=3056648 RepID=UPI00260BE0BD|nr:TRAP transporter large permease subunit [Bradyrhizobium roseus]WKA26481.1 TRAP transporter large permease subunit [Bradyrhizobium roseus]
MSESRTKAISDPVGNELASATGLRRLAEVVDRILGVVTELPAAALVVAEILILLTGVFTRYVLNDPLVWTDELASILFLWLAMLGAVIAMRRNAHMRLTFFVARLAPDARATLETIAAFATLAFVALLIVPAFDYAVHEAIVRTPALGLPGSVKSAAVATGLVLIFVIAAIRLISTSTSRQLAMAFALVAAIWCLLWLAQGSLRSIGNYNLVVFFVGLVGLCIAAGVPIAFAFGLATIAYLGLMGSTPLSVVVSRVEEGMGHLVLLSVPLFVFLGLLIELTGMARAMVAFLVALIGHVRGGLSYVLLGAIYLVSGISGSKAADMAAVAPILFPEMKRRGSKPGELVALLSTSAAMSETIPPSLVLITIGSVTNVSIAALFTGGLLPALVLAIILGILAGYRSRSEVIAGLRRAGGRDIALALLIALPALVLPFIIRAAVVEGVATATEVSTIGIVYSVLCGILIYRRFEIRRLASMLVDTAALTGAILLIIGCATAMAWALTQSGFSRDLAAMMAHVPGGKWGFIVLSIVVFVVLGSVLEGIPALVLFGPLLFPIARMLGVHEVHYAMIVILAMGIGLFAPPLGVGYYTACAIGRVDPDEGMGAIWPYLGALIVGLLIVAFVPWLSIGFL